MVDLGEGATGLRFDVDEQPEGFGPSVRWAQEARLLMALSVWPRMVAVFEGADLLPVARVEQEGRHPAGTVVLELGEHAGMQGRWWGDEALAVVGELPLPDADVWWTRLDDGRLYGRHADLMAACSVAGLDEPTRMSPPAELHRAKTVLMLGGPMDGQVMDTTCSEIEVLGVLVGTRWHKPSDCDPEFAAEAARPVFYRVRRGNDVAEAFGRDVRSCEWVATFEGERKAENAWPEGWTDVGATTEPGPAGAEREAVLDVLEPVVREAVKQEGGYTYREVAGAVLDALIGDDLLGHVQCEGEADPDEVLVAIVDGMDAYHAGPSPAATRAGGLVEQALDVARVLGERFTVHPRPTP